MTLLQLEYFKALSRIMHYSKAAEALHTSQPNLSYAIGELEKELGKPLFQRSGRSISLTPYGLQFAHYVDESLNALVKGREIISQMDAVNDSFSLAFIEEVGFDFLPDLLRDFVHENPGIRPMMSMKHNTSIVAGLIDDEYDIALSIENNNYPQLISQPILSQQMMLIVPEGHRLSNRTSVSLNEIGLDPVVLSNRKTGIRRITDDMCREAHVTLVTYAEVEDSNSAVAYVSAGLAMSILPRTPLIGISHLKAIPIVYPSRCRNICVLYRNDKPLSPAAQKFRDFVLRRFPEIK